MWRLSTLPCLGPGRARDLARAWGGVARVLMAWLWLGRIAGAEVELPRPDPLETIAISAASAARWEQGAVEVWLLRGCQIRQGFTAARADEAVLWIKRSGSFGNRQNLVQTYLEGHVEIDYQRAGYPYKLTERSWFGEFFSVSPLELRTPPPGAEPAVKPPVWQNAAARRDPLTNRSIRRTEFGPGEAAAPQPPGSEVVPVPAGRRLRAFPRSSVRVQAQWFPSPGGNEWIAVITNGVNLIIDGVEGLGPLDVSADRIVLWTRGADQPDLSGQTAQGSDTPLELYLEGNIVFRQGDRVIQAARMYYDVNNSLGTVLEADVLTPVSSFGGLVRLKAAVLQQTGRDRFLAQNAFVTSSRLGEPRYRVQSQNVSFEDLQQGAVDPLTGAPLVDPVTGEQQILHNKRVIGRNNFVFLGPVPVFYWPVFAADLEDPVSYVRSIKYKSDSIFGQQVYGDFDLFQLAGFRRPEGTDWILSTDYLSLRGLALGTTFKYERPAFFGVPGPATGLIDAWGLSDRGLDQLGQNRFNLVPEQTFRYRVFGQHRQYLPDDWRLTAELGVISDRNFLEQYFEREWDTQKDQITGLELKRLWDNQSFSVTTDVRVNAFLTQTNWLPRLDHYLVGQPLLADWFTWHEHSSIGYAQLRIRSTPLNPSDIVQQQPLPWEVPSQGGRYVTRQELDLPLNVGPFKVVPYALGELGHWGQDLAGNPYDRAYGQAGVRASIPFWTLNPTIESDIFNVHGLAHKIVLEADVSYANSNRTMMDLPLYDPLDDDSNEHWRRTLTQITFGGVTPAQFDERSYALRSGLAGWVTSPSAEIADKLAAVRLGARQRWQTKRGPPDRRRIIDWITLDTQGVLFPNAANDNFGQVAGLVDYDFRWHVGDRFTVLSSGMFDFFAQGQKTYSLAINLSHPPRGNLYAGFYGLGGPVNSYVFNTSYVYRLSPKWNSSAGASFDVSGLGWIGNSLALTRIGESFQTTFLFTYDRFKQNVGFNFMIEPRFLARGRLGAPTAPLAGATGLE